MVTEAYILKEYEIISSKYVKLNRPVRTNDIWVITGFFDVIDADGYCWDTYGIKIVIPPDFPLKLPTLVETTGKIKHDISWHNVQGVCCLSTEAIMYKTLGTPISLLKWLDRFVHDFLANHVIKVKENNYAQGEFSHGTDGVIEGYKEIFGTSDVNQVVKKMNEITCKLRIRRNLKCFCGSGKKFKHCYDASPYTHTFENIPIPLIEKDLIEIRRHIRRQSN